MMAKTKRKTFVLDIDMIAALIRRAERERRDQSSVVREALEEYLGVPDKVKSGRPIDGNGSQNEG
jgi:hypothetical protein